MTMEEKELNGPFVYIKGVAGRGEEVKELLREHGAVTSGDADCTCAVDTLYYYIGLDKQIHNTSTIPEVYKAFYKEIFLPEKEPLADLKQAIEDLFERNKITGAQIVELTKDELVLAHKEEPFPRVHAIAFIFINKISKLVVKPDFNEFASARYGYIGRLFNLGNAIYSNRIILDNLERLFYEYNNDVKNTTR